ncbi:uncharacterized protein MYCFIDRAFT_126975 [Pseudocercospora fijiensis CIRAD86]|uniref:Uncharacterized protein n=1 Tax=Pseudocercospora fijiensis (strain CIRAD86) TaxID=383855 RepID=N1Q9L7_PSEFD|nr:uncharacterized protein MYCFIDRAFT_126975 [Pseudocercospora fijiensis CIRAD86]EME87583.1 hypothetical protein MYCFIDRAFT_126975 [Pseudocercospora fijiensis CIRAD86]
MAKKKGTAEPAQPTDANSAGSSLIICRNKHWRYISSFHGPWLQLPPEILDNLAHQNWTMPPPRLVDPAVFYDVVKIRKSVDQASDDSVRASTGVSSTAMHGKMDYFGTGGGHSTKLSKERIFKIRQKAVKLLSKAFQLDEVAASVATMQATSTIENVGLEVLRREPNSTDARYVHFFHEKIPSRAMEENTPLDPLNDIINALPQEHQPAPLRTRALVQIFKKQWDGAAYDLSIALQIVEQLKRQHKPNQQQLELASKMRQEQEAWQRGFRDWKSMPPLKEEDQPSSLEMQLLFNRAGVYLTIACQSVHEALDGLKEYQEASERGETNGVDAKAQQKRLDARKVVKTNAKRAMKDYIAFLSHFDYTPGLPFELTNEIMRRVYDLASGHKTQSQTQMPLPKNRLNGFPRFPSPKIYPSSALFAEKPPPDLPPFPTAETTEAISTELLRHAHNAARLARIADGYPIFQAARSPARADWIEVLRRANNWIGLGVSWQKLCAPAPLPDAAGGWAKENSANSSSALARRKKAREDETPEQKKERVKQESILEALSDDRVVDEESFQKAVRAREKRAMEDEQGLSGPLKDKQQATIKDSSASNPGSSSASTNGDSENHPPPKRWAQDENSKEYPISTDRAEAIARWIRESPLSMGGKKKKKSKRRDPATNGLADSVSSLRVAEEEDGPD